jgi:hypothetical protein
VYCFGNKRMGPCSLFGRNVSHKNLLVRKQKKRRMHGSTSLRRLKSEHFLKPTMLTPAHTAGVDMQMIEYAEQILQQSESLEFVVDVAAGIDAIESEGGTVSTD